MFIGECTLKSPRLKPGLVAEHWRSASKTRLTTHLFPFRARATRDPKVETSSLPSVVVARVASGNDVLLLLGLARFRGALALEEVVLDAVLLAVRGELLLAVPHQGAQLGERRNVLAVAQVWSVLPPLDLEAVAPVLDGVAHDRVHDAVAVLSFNSIQTPPSGERLSS